LKSQIIRLNKLAITDHSSKLVRIPILTSSSNHRSHHKKYKNPNRTMITVASATNSSVRAS